ncbi:MAG TPA: hypothetical protein ENJ32_07030 [Crenotrichaceae bacterium]|nr:hypothetical protein [Crenotrichaceae bacterium]
MSALKNPGWALTGLCLLMLATRFNHFGSVATLPDASLAVFFFGGIYLRKIKWFVILLLEAALIDFIAIEYAGVSSYCISPAYVFLIPTYGVMWASGFFCTHLNLLSTRGFVQSTGLLITATTIAFLISNISFYLFSGRFSDLVLTDYFTRVAPYYSPYLLSTLVYSSLIVMIHFGLRSFAAPIQHSNHS